MPKIDDQLKQLLGAGQDVGVNMAQGMSPARAALAAAGDAVKAQILGPAVGVAGIFLGVSRTLATIIRQTDMWGKGMAQVRQLEQWQSKFETILRSTTLAKERMRELASMSVRTPFKLDELAGASRNLELLTKGAWATRNALATVGDAATASGARIEDVAFAVGKLHSFLQSGRSVQNLAFNLQSMGVISGELQNRLELMQASGAGFTQMWGAVTEELNRTRGAMAAEMNTLGGLTARLEAAREAMARGYGENFVQQEQNAIYASLKATEALSPVLKLIGRDVASVTGVWNGWTASLKGSIYDTLGASKALEVLWRGFTLVGAGISGAMGASLGKFVGGIGKQRAELKSSMALGMPSTSTRDWLRSRAEQRAAATRSFSEAREALFSGAFIQAGMSAGAGIYQRGRAYVSRLGAAGAAASAGTRAAAAASGQAVEEALLRRSASAAAMKAVALTAVGDAAGVAAAGGKKLLGMLAGMVTSIPVYGWIAAGITAVAAATGLWIRNSREAKLRVDDLTKGLRESREAFLRQAQAITTAEQRTAALAKAYENLADAQTKRANAKTDGERAVADKAITQIQGDIQRTRRRLVGRSMSEDDIQQATERRYYEMYEAPVAELEAQLEGASPARRAAITEQIAQRRRDQRQAGEKRVAEQMAFENSDRGRDYADLLNQRDQIAGSKDAAAAIIAQQRIVEANRFTTDIRGREYERTLIGGHSRGSPEGRAAEARSIAARDQIERLRRYEQPENAKDFEAYKQAQVNELNKRIDQIAPDAETTGRVKSLIKDVESNPNLTEQERIAKMEEAQRLQVDLRASNMNAQRSKGASGAEAVDVANRAAAQARYDLRMYTERLEIERQILDIRESGWKASEAEQEARVESAKRELSIIKDLGRERGEADAGVEMEARLKIAGLERELALSRASHRDTMNKARQPLEQARAANAIELAKLGGDIPQAIQLSEEQRRRQITERLYNARQQGIASGMDGDEAMNLERDKIIEEHRAGLIAQYQAEEAAAIGAEPDRDKRARLERGLGYKKRVAELQLQGVSASAAQAQAEKEFGGAGSGLSSAINEADFFAAGRPSFQDRLAADTASFLATIQSPGRTNEERARRGLKPIPGLGAGHTPSELARGGKAEGADLTGVLKELSKKFADAESVLVIKAK